MLRRKISQRNSLKFKNRKIFLKDLPKRAIKTKILSLRWILIPIFFFIIFGIFVLFLISLNSYLRIMIGYSITGFLIFFMAYFGWILAQVVIDKITVEKQKNGNSILYFFRKLKKNNEQ